MYTPTHFRMANRDHIVEFMHKHSFATLVSMLDGQPFATHLPFVVHATEDSIKLQGHVARANPHWHAFNTDQDALVIFGGPHAYISPSLYDSSLNVPTWNYVAVHAYGIVRTITDSTAVERAIKALIVSHEPAYNEQWAALPETYKTRMLNAVIAFEITVTRLEGKEKLSQYRSAAEQLQIISALEHHREPGAQAVAQYMAAIQTNPTAM